MPHYKYLQLIYTLKCDRGVVEDSSGDLYNSGELCTPKGQGSSGEEWWPNNVLTI